MGGSGREQGEMIEDWNHFFSLLHRIVRSPWHLEQRSLFLIYQQRIAYIQSSFTQRKRSDPPTEQASTTGQKHKLQLRKKTLMDKQNLMPQAAGPVNRTTTGQLPGVLAELSEEALQLHGDSANAKAAAVFANGLEFSGDMSVCYCSCDGDDAE